METIFKVGMEVYDDFNFPNVKGVVKSIEKDCMGFWFVDVKFNKFVQSYTLQGSLPVISATPTLSTKPYKVELKGFEQKAPAPTFDKALNWLRDNNLYDVSISDDSTVTYFTKKENYTAFEALRKLVIFRDYYNEGWQPDFLGKNDWKFCIITHCNRLAKDTTFSDCRVMTFKTEEIRDKFLEEQRELLEIAKPLL